MESGTHCVMSKTSTVLQSRSSMNGRHAIPLYAGCTPASQTIVRPRYCKTQQDRPTSCPAPRRVMRSFGTSDIDKTVWSCRSTARQGPRDEAGKADGGWRTTWPSAAESGVLLRPAKRLCKVCRPKSPQLVRYCFFVPSLSTSVLSCYHFSKRWRSSRNSEPNTPVLA